MNGSFFPASDCKMRMSWNYGKYYMESMLLLWVKNYNILILLVKRLNYIDISCNLVNGNDSKKLLITCTRLLGCKATLLLEVSSLYQSTAISFKRGSPPAT